MSSIAAIERMMKGFALEGKDRVNDFYRKQLQSPADPLMLMLAKLQDELKALNIQYQSHQSPSLKAVIEAKSKNIEGINNLLEAVTDVFVKSGMDAQLDRDNMAISNIMNA